jgi:hypothetical protein
MNNIKAVTRKLDEWHTQGQDERRDALIDALRIALETVQYYGNTPLIGHSGRTAQLCLRDIAEKLGVKCDHQWVIAGKLNGLPFEDCVHDCCGCSCHVCENGHGTGTQPHSKECLERFEQIVLHVITERLG